MAHASEGGGPVSARNRLLDAAELIVARDGIGHLTLEAVANEAGVSKGGLLYHFPAKSALISAVIERLIEQCESEQEAAAAVDPEAEGAFLRSYLTVRTKPVDPLNETLRTAVVVALGTDPEYLKPLRERLTTWQARLVNDGIDPVTASIVRLAIDGLVVGRLLKVPTPEGELREKVIERLLSMTHPQSAHEQP